MSIPMLITGQTLYAFVDPKDPFMAGEVAGEAQPGPILSVMGTQPFDNLLLFHTPHTRDAAEATRKEVHRRYPQCHTLVHELAVSDPKDYSALMGELARHVREFARMSRHSENSVCVSSGTAEMRAAWFLLQASGVLQATLLQVGSPAQPLFGPANVKEVRLDSDWSSLRDLVMPAQYFDREPRFQLPYRAEGAPLPATHEEHPGLDEALQSLGIFIASAKLRLAAERAAVAAGCDAPVLLLGETGTGKELFAKLLHKLSARREGPRVAVNCASMPKDLVESCLFGHVKGAFTGATTAQQGKFEAANGGTLFLDEIGELTLDAQAKMLRVIQENEVEPVGSNRPRRVDLRIVAATNRNLRNEVAAGRFREDLYYRLEVVHICLPALRERREEIPHLALELLKRVNFRRQHPRQLSKEALRRLERHDWPGNVRELSNVIERSVLYARTDVLAPEDILIDAEQPGADPLSTLPEPGPGFSLEEFLAQARRHLILRALAKSENNQSAAAEMLGISKQAVSKFVKDNGR